MNIGFYIYPGFQLLDLSGPLAVFQLVGRIDPQNPYSLTVFSFHGGLVESSAAVCVNSEILTNQQLDTLIVCGGRGATEAIEETQEFRELKIILEGVRRIASVSTGAFILARLGILAKKRATTHWKYVAKMQKKYPSILVDGDKIFVQDGKVWTSAGIASGIDLALALIKQDLGDVIARGVANYMVVYKRRWGGQSQYSPLLKIEADTKRVSRAIDYIREHLAESFHIPQLASVACLSVRQFNRIFKAEVGDTPARVVERMRVEMACSKLESGDVNMEQIAKEVGFDNLGRMRRAFLQWLGQPPQVIKRRIAVRP